jgi:hypothetical protein
MRMGSGAPCAEPRFEDVASGDDETTLKECPATFDLSQRFFAIAAIGWTGLSLQLSFSIK